MRNIAIVLITASFSLASRGAVTPIQVEDAARQQGIVTFRVANPAQCTVAVYSDAALSQKMDDTNNAVFAGSESCTRAYNIVTGKQVTAVLGRRTSEVAADGKLHSHSLAVATMYWVRVTDLTDNSTATATFTTANIPWGDTHVEDVPVNPAGFGGWAYPDLDWSDAAQNKTYVDPLTGVLFRRVARNQQGQGGQWGDGTFAAYPFDPPVDVQGAWTNTANILSTSTAGPFASYSGSSQAPIFLPFAHAQPVFGDKSFQTASDNSGLKNLEDVTVTIYGFASGSVEDRKVLVCLAVNYVPANNVCPGPEIEVTLPVSAGSVTIPSSYPAWQFAGWNAGRYLNSEEIAIYSGQAAVAASAVTLTNNSFLPVNAVAGMKINIAGTWYTIGTITTAASFTLAEPGVSVTGAWYLGNFGIRVRKKTAANNTINVAASFSYAYTVNPNIDPNGQSRDYCSRLTFPVTYQADGTTLLNPPQQGRLCLTGSGFQTLFILLEDGSSRFVSGIKDNNYTLPMLGEFSPTDPYTFIATAPDPADPAGGLAFWRGNYDYTACKFKSWTGNGYDRTQTGPDNCIRWSNMNPYGSGRTVNEQINAALVSNPIWDASLTRHFTLSGISGTYAVMSQFVVNQNGPCLVAVFDMVSFDLVKLFDSFSGSVPGLRWGGCHSNGVALVDGAGNAAFDLSLMTASGYTGYLSGPFELPAFTAKSLDGGATWSSDTSLASGHLVDTSTSAGKCGPSPWTVGSQCVDLTNAAGPCGANDFGVTGYQCVKLKVATDLPCSGNAGTVDAGKWPCTWNPGSGRSSSPLTVQPGDYLSRGSAPGSGGAPFDGKNEKMRVLSKVSAGAGSYILEVQRWSRGDNPTSDSQGTPPALLYYDHLYSGRPGNTHDKGWTAYMTPSGGETWIDLSTPLAQTRWSSDETGITGDGGHNSLGVGPDGVTTLSVGGGFARTGNMPAAASVNPEHHFERNLSSFGGVSKVTDHLETYPTVGNWTAPTVQRRSLYWDWRHVNPDTGYSGDQPVKMWPHAYTRLTGQQYTYKMDIRNDLHNHKERRPNVFSTRVGFRDISGPATGNVIDDSKPNTYCYAYKANECRQGSAAGDLYVVAKNAWIELGGCVVNSLKAYTPCASNLESNAAWMIEGDTQRDDPLGYRFRRITMGLTGPGAQYGYTSPHLTPDTAYAFMRPSWLNGIKPDFMVVKMPPPAATDSIDRTTYVPVPNVFGPGSGYVRIRFGYAENGTATEFHCTTRQEACLTDANVSPFVYEQTDTPAAQDCRNGCTINVPALSGRVVYYRVEKSPNGTNEWVSGALQVKAVK